MGIRNEPSTGAEAAGGWPPWARGLASALLVFHLTALLIGVLGAVPPSSVTEQAAYRKFKPYYDLIDQGYAYNYYAPAPPPTPVVEAALHFADGRPDRLVRLPERGAWPMLRYQRQLALAHALHEDYEMAKNATGDGTKSRWARSFSRHLGQAYPGCFSVSLRVRMHEIPDLQRVHDALESPRAPRIDLDAPEYFSDPIEIGDFPCAD